MSKTLSFYAWLQHLEPTWWQITCVNLSRMHNSALSNSIFTQDSLVFVPHGPLARYVILRDAHAPGMPGTFSPPPRFSDPDMHHGTCVTHVPWCMSGSLTSSFLWSRPRGKTFPAFPAHAQPAILRIWQEAHGPTGNKSSSVQVMTSFSVWNFNLGQRWANSLMCIINKWRKILLNH